MFKPNETYLKYVKRLDKMSALRDGVEQLRNRTYLPQLEKEDDPSYDNRVNAVVLTNFTQRTISATLGVMFRKPLKLDKSFKTKGDSITPEGESIQYFIKTFTESALWFGHAFLLVDAPNIQSDDVIRTRADELREGIQPYFTLIERPQLLDFEFKRVRGKNILTKAVIEEVVAGDSFYRELYIGGGKLYDEGGEQLSEWSNNLDYIPLFPFYTRKTGFYESVPMFENIADLTIRHFQYDSMLWRIHAYAGNPVLKIYGSLINEDDDEGIKMAVNSAFTFINKEEGDAQWLVYEGKEAQLFERSMNDIESRIAMLGMSLLSVKKSSKEMTATEKSIDSYQEQGDILSIAQNLEDVVNKALEAWLTMAGEKIPKDVKFVELNKDFVRYQIDSQELMQLQSMYASRLLSKDAIWTILEKGGMLDGIDLDIMRSQIEADAGDLELIDESRTHY